MVQCRANRPQQYIEILKEVTMEAMKLRTLGATKPIIKRVKAKPRILVKKDI